MIIFLWVIYMEQRTGKIIISSAGGTASSGAKTYKISIPSAWVNEMGLNESKREVELSFDGRVISVTARLSAEEFVKQKKAENHDVRKINFYDGNELCSTIYADFSDKTLKAENFTSDIVKTVFGNNTFPMWEDFEDFLEERCVPRERSGIREYLEALGLDEYDPIEIIKKTHGRMAEDEQWLTIEKI